LSIYGPLVAWVLGRWFVGFRRWILSRWFIDFRHWILSRWFVDFCHWILSRWFVDFRRWILSRWFKCNDFHRVHCRDLCWPVQVHLAETKENKFHFQVDWNLEVLGHKCVPFGRILGLVVISEQLR
jgi:hypothetical protein